MKPGLVYALSVVILMMAIVILVQQRKLSAERDANATLHTDTRALHSARGVEAAAASDLQRELRQLRTENDQLRQDLHRARSGGN